MTDHPKSLKFLLRKQIRVNQQSASESNKITKRIHHKIQRNFPVLAKEGNALFIIDIHIINQMYGGKIMKTESRNHINLRSKLYVRRAHGINCKNVFSYGENDI